MSKSIEVTDEQLYQWYIENNKNASSLAPRLGCHPSNARRAVAKALQRLGYMPLLTEQDDPEIPNLIMAQLAKASIALEGSRINSAWVKSKHVSVHISPDKPEVNLPDRPYRVAFIDIETAPNLGWTWQKYETTVIEFAKEWFMLSFAVKWADEDVTRVYTLPDFAGYDEDRDNDAQLTARLWSVLDEADLVVAHNGDRFDIKKANARFLKHGMTPPSPYRTVDTLKVARRNFALTSNKLTDIAQALGIGKKAETGGFKLWLDCMAGDRKAWRKMAQYNKQDVILLEQVYEKLRPWHGNHPHTEMGACVVCGSDHLVKRGTGFKSGKKIQRYQCYDCGRWA